MFWAKLQKVSESALQVEDNHVMFENARLVDLDTVGRKDRAGQIGLDR